MRPTPSSSCSMHVIQLGAVGPWSTGRGQATQARIGGQASRLCAQQNRCVNSILLLFIWMIIDIRSYYCNVDLVLHENAQAWLKHPGHNSDAPIPLCRFASAYEHGIWHGPSIAPPPQDIQMSATVGVVGFPNIGKGSLINILKWAKVCRRVS